MTGSGNRLFAARRDELLISVPFKSPYFSDGRRRLCEGAWRAGARNYRHRRKWMLPYDGADTLMFDTECSMGLAVGSVDA